MLFGEVSSQCGDDDVSKFLLIYIIYLSSFHFTLVNLFQFI